MVIVSLAPRCRGAQHWSVADTRATMTETADRLRLLLVIAMVGIGTGVLTLLGQGVLDAGWNRLANSGAVWLMVGFLVGSRMPSFAWAMVAGVGTLVGAIAGYFAAAIAIAHAGASPSSIAIWTGVAIVGGPLYGVAGRWWRDERRMRRSIAIGLMGGILSAEGAATLLRIPDLSSVGWVEVVGGIVLTLLLGRSWRDRAGGLAVVPVVIVLGVAAYQVIDWLFIA